MRLCDKDIIAALDKGLIGITPSPDKKNIAGISVDLRLGNSFRVFNDHQAPYVDLSGPKQDLAATLERVMSQEIILAQGDAFFLHPGELALAVTKECISLSAGISGWLDGRSSLARLGLMVHATAHRIDPGWNGQIVLEFFNSGKLPLALRPNMLIGAISFERLSGECLQPYNKRQNAKYQDQDKAIPMRINRDHCL